MHSQTTFLRRFGFASFSLVLLTVGLIHGPIHQPAHYHAFADLYAYMGIPNTMDVLTNIGFLIAGLLGIYHYRQDSKNAGAWVICFYSLIGTAFGSAYYHLQPNDVRLVWDRLPITLTCISVLIATSHSQKNNWLALFVGSMYALFSIAWWRHTGDLMFYLLVQIIALIWIPLNLYLHQRVVSCRWALLASTCYLIAKICEWQDHLIFDHLLISGHSLKHVFAGLAAICLVRIYQTQSQHIARANAYHDKQQIHVS
ncbi:hypothetical protein LIN78_00310 [Leeia sp. TBRC 13508]|uniref:Alkaline phytoceramidase n=1 Tax=Leeia speluncae TaxID=2884804 RepID=A0ABS8D1D2_9NEIS|nr:hypothetical protein [Leeia speluncae]MCB6181997.1 hypothetical protein [Leeia speluncae]